MQGCRALLFLLLLMHFTIILRFIAQLKFLAQVSWRGSTLQYNWINLHLDERVHVERTVLTYDSTSLLVEIGSCLGLWLGLSVVGVYDIAVIAVYKVKNCLTVPGSTSNKKN